MDDKEMIHWCGGLAMANCGDPEGKAFQSVRKRSMLEIA